MYGSLQRNDQVSGPGDAVAAAVRAAASALEHLAAQLNSSSDIRTLSSDDPGDDREALREENRQLREALDSRATIERAKGMLMARHGCSEQDAFKMLADTARRQQRKVRRVAEDLLTAGFAADLTVRRLDPRSAVRSGRAALYGQAEGVPGRVGEDPEPLAAAVQP
jgi:hypothetical protein